MAMSVDVVTLGDFAAFREYTLDKHCANTHALGCPGGAPDTGRLRSSRMLGHPATPYAVAMATPATEIEVGGTAVRVSSPDRVVFPATDSTPEATKLDVVKYYASVGPGILRALHLRPTTLERWPKGVHPGIRQATRTDPHGDAFY
jgi:hypothetical protein